MRYDCGDKKKREETIEVIKEAQKVLLEEIKRLEFPQEEAEALFKKTAEGLEEVSGRTCFDFDSEIKFTNLQNRAMRDIREMLSLLKESTEVKRLFRKEVESKKEIMEKLI